MKHTIRWKKLKIHKIPSTWICKCFWDRNRTNSSSKATWWWIWVAFTSLPSFSWTSMTRLKRLGKNFIRWEIWILNCRLRISKMPLSLLLEVKNLMMCTSPLNMEFGLVLLTIIRNSIGPSCRMGERFTFCLPVWLVIFSWEWPKWCT